MTTSLQTISTIPSYIFSTSTLPSTQSIYPTPFPQNICTTSLESVDSSNPACGTFVNNSTLSIMRSCCNGAPLVLYFGGCNVYCNAQDQNVAQLSSCIERAEIGTNQTNKEWICNVRGESASATLPAETATAGFATAVAAASSSSVAAAATSKAAAVKGVQAGGLMGSLWGVVGTALMVCAGVAMNLA